ncbi:hypothetical protein LIER_08323 [Lithospermum erythrorhizon]|uniref:Uncharacterized protein n=1 Tax=Lithospermum erythrorhizon TaxID=34254 RepID=A0AAV3PG90_LITER
MKKEFKRRPPEFVCRTWRRRRWRTCSSEKNRLRRKLTGVTDRRRLVKKIRGSEQKTPKMTSEKKIRAGEDHRSFAVRRRSCGVFDRRRTLSRSSELLTGAPSPEFHCYEGHRSKTLEEDHI